MTKNLLPLHPVEVLREEFLAPLGVTVVALAEACCVIAMRIRNR